MIATRPLRRPDIEAPASGRRWMERMLLALAAILAAAGLAVAASSSDDDSDVHSVAATLRCPTCVAESVADSTAPLSAGMREIIAEQLAEGRSPAEIRAWFAERYGDEVLLDPPPQGAGWPLWLLPFAIAPLALWLLIRQHGRRRWGLLAVTVLTALGFGAWWLSDDSDPRVRATPETEYPATSIDMLEQAAAEAPGDAQIRTALARSLDEQGRVAEAAEHYAAAVRLAPHDETLLYRAAFALVRSDRPDEATPLLEELLVRDGNHPEALLLLGTVLDREDDVRGDELLCRFVEVAPDHPAAAPVEEELTGCRE